MIYKGFTSILATKIREHYISNELIPSEQKGNSTNSKGCIDQLLIDKVILSDAKRNKKHLSVAWIDYKKAFDSVPHSWIVESLQMHGINKNLVRFIESTSKMWKTNLNLNHEKGTLDAGEINVKCGIFQGDCLSLLLFCITLFPLSWLLNRSNLGYYVGK